MMEGLPERPILPPGLSLMWTHGQRHGLKVQDLVKLLCENTAKLTGIGHRKGRIATGYDADFVVWNPDKFYTVFLIFKPWIELRVIKVQIAANCKDVCLKNTSKSHSYHLKIWKLL